MDWVPVLAGALAAVHPYLVALSALVLSEALFLPLMMLGLWGLARLWDKTKPSGFVLTAIGTGLAMGAAILGQAVVGVVRADGPGKLGDRRGTGLAVEGGSRVGGRGPGDGGDPGSVVDPQRARDRPVRADGLMGRGESLRRDQSAGQRVERHGVRRSA